MDSSPEPSSSTDDGKSYRSYGDSRIDTNPVRRYPSTGMLRLPGRSIPATIDSRNEPGYLGSHRVLDSKPNSEYSSKDALMTETDVKRAMPGVLKEYNEKREAAGKLPWYQLSECHDERHKDVPETVPATRRYPRRRVSQPVTTQPSGVSKSKSARPGPSRSSRNEPVEVATRGGRGWTNSDLKRQNTLPESQNDGLSIRSRGTADVLPDGFGKIKMDDGEE